MIQINNDIIKAHGGDSDSDRKKVEPKEGEGSAFNIIPPLNQHI